jgi:Spx/MgsR family transcriptional regulator
VKNTTIPTLIGIPNCDMVRDARKWLDQHNLLYTFRDFRQQPLSADELSELLEAIGAERLFNRRSTPWKTLGFTPETPVSVLFETALQQPTLLKRPMFSTKNGWIAGFNANDWSALLL